MYYNFLRSKSKSNYEFNLAQIQNHYIDQISAYDCANLVGTVGSVKIEALATLNEIKKWVLELGYFTNQKIPSQQNSNFTDNLKYFPDNEEMLLLFNNSNERVEITVFNSTEVIKKNATFKTLDLYDDMWVKVVKPNNIDDCSKNIKDSLNFNIENATRYLPMRCFDHYLQKLVPRHPFYTPCLHLPLDIEHKDLEIYYWSKSLATPEQIISIYGCCHDPECSVVVELLPYQSLIIDQIICQYKISNHQHIEYFPCWYKTKNRKSFNYSF